MLSLTEAKKTNPISLENSAEPELQGGYVGEQSAKLHLALGEQSPGLDMISSSMTSGNDVEYKRLLADRENLRKIDARNSVMSDIMAAGPEMVTPETIDIVKGLSDVELRSENLRDVIERNYAKTYTNMAVASIENDIVEDAEKVDQNVTLDLMDRTERVVYKNNLIATKAAELQKRVDDLGWGESVWNFTERLIPFMEWYQKQNATGESEMVSSVLPGSNLQEQFAYMWGISDPTAFNDRLEATLADLEERNPYVAQSWLQGLVSYGSSDAVIDNLFGLSDAATAIPFKTLGSALKGVARSSIKSPLKVHQHATALGKNAEAATGKVVEELKVGSFLEPDINDFKGLEQSVPSIFAPDTLLTGTQNVPQAAYLRLKEALKESSELAQRFILEPNLIDRADPGELVKYKDTLLRDYVKANPSIQKNVIDVRIADEADIGNVYRAEIVLGRADGTLFESAEGAERYFKNWIGGTSDYTVQQVGQGFQIVIKKTVDESKFLTDLELPTLSKTPQSLGALFGGWWRSPNYLVSRNAELQRSTAVTSMEQMGMIYERLAEPFQRLDSTSLKELNDLMAVNQHSAEFKNFGEFEQAFYLKYLKNPTMDQAETYFAAKQMMDLDLIVRDLDWYKQKAIQGREKITVGDKTFEGKVLESLPFGDDEDFAYSIFKDGSFGPRKLSKFSNEKARQEVADLLASGHKVVQVAGQNLKIGEKSYVGFVVAPALKRDRVGVQNIQRRPGGHKVDTYTYYAKQGVFNEGADRTFYNSDKTLWGFQNGQVGKEFVEGLETARKMFNAKNPEALKYIRDKLGIDTKRWMSAVASGEIDLTKKFVLTPKGKRTIDTGAYKDLPNLQEGVSKFNLDAKLIGRYGSERDASSIDVVTSESDIAFEIKGAEFLSPIDTLRMSAKNVISTRMMHDYTLVTHRNFINEFSDILEGTREELFSSGVSTLTDPKFLSGADPKKVRAARNVSRSYRNLLNQGTDFDNLLESYKDKLVSTAVGKKMMNWVPDRMISTVKDPAVAMRSFAFHTKMGFFNPTQYFVQANSMVNVVSIGGANGMKSAALYPMFRLALANGNDRVLRGIANKAQTIGLMKSDEFLESLSLYKKSGFNQIGKDTAYLDDARGPEIRRGKIRTVLDYGATPFNEGERLVRLSAWNTAYLEMKQSGKKIGRREEAVILQRAKDLTANMTRESNAVWQKGYAGLVTQFMGYQARIMEQFIGKKLTTAEKIRLFMGYSAVYGLPVAGGATLGILPVRDMVMDYLVASGQDPNGTAAELVTDGLVSGFYELLMGEELNIADRYGPGGLPTLYDFLREDSTWSDIFLGASGSIAIDTVSSSMPFIKAMASEFMDFEGGTHNLTVDDIIAPLRNITTVDSLVKLNQVYNAGIWLTKSGTRMDEVDMGDAVMATLTGLTPAEFEDTFRRMKATKSWKEHEEAVMKEVSNEYRDLLRMEDSKTRDKMIRDLKTRMVLEGLSLQQMKTVWQRGFNQEMMVDSVLERYTKELQKRQRREQDGVQ